MILLRESSFLSCFSNFTRFSSFLIKLFHGLPELIGDILERVALVAAIPILRKFLSRVEYYSYMLIEEGDLQTKVTSSPNHAFWFSINWN